MRRALMAAIVCLASAGARGEGILNLGDPAPPLAVSTWVKGEKIDGFEPGKTYVVEFWATWCGPCRASIPHLTELAHKYKDKGVRFVGVDIWEQDTSLVEPFLKEMGDKMDYNVALDQVPKDGEPQTGAMATTWMKAAEEHGIPTAFVIHDRNIAWIGHPMSMDEPLAKIVAGDWDPKSHAKERLDRKAEERALSEVRGKIFKPFRAGDYKATLAAIDEATQSNPTLAEQFATIKCVCLCNGVDVERGLELGEAFVKSHNDEVGELNSLAWMIVDPSVEHDVDPRAARLAVRASQRAVELTDGKNFAVLDTYAEARYRSGDVTGAVDSQEKALHLLEAEVKDPAHRVLKACRDRLERYRTAAKEKSPQP